MKLLWITCAILVVATNIADARRKRKFDGDFEFAEEDDVKNVATSGKVSEKKRWIHDPSSELCQPLNCKKKELCLLENPYTAVCVSKKDLHKSGDVVVPKSKLSPEEAAKYSQEQSDDDVFYDSDDEDDEEDPESNQDVLTARCNPCPVVKPTFLCGTDNRTYSSLCRLDYHNCIHHTAVKVYCKGFCPCKEGEAHRKKQKQESERLTNLMNKYKATVLEESKAKENLGNSIDKYTFTPQDFNYENKHYKYIKYTKHENKPSKVVTNPPYYEDKERNRGDNDVIERKTNVRAKSECPPSALQAMGDRLLDWFSVIMADSKRRQTHTRTKTLAASTRFPAGCKNEVRWMFHHLDADSDSKLTLQELYDLEHDQNERCIKPFLDECDIDRDIFVTPHEWCKCFDKTDRPCAAVKRRISTNMLGVYVPECDSEGYYYHTQCHVSVGMCWCVDKHGVELPNSRTRGKPNCETLLGKSKGKQAEVVSDDDEDDDDDSDQDIEGSADQPLDF